MDNNVQNGVTRNSNPYSNMNNNYKICYNCKQYCNINDTTCRYCGTKFAQPRPQFQTEVQSQSQGFYRNQQQQQYFQKMQQRQQYRPQTQQQQYYYPQNNPTPDAKKYSMSGFILSIVGLIGSMLSVFLPYVELTGLGYKDSTIMFGNTTDSYIILVFAFLSLVFLLCKCKTYTIDVMLSGLLFVILGIYHYQYCSSQIVQSDDYSSTLVHVGFGLYLLLFSGILTLIGGITLFVYKRNNE